MDIDIDGYELSQLIFWFPIEIYLKYLSVLNKKNYAKGSLPFPTTFFFGTVADT